MDPILIVLLGLSLGTGAVLRRGAPVFIVIPASLFSGAVVGIYCVAAKYSVLSIVAAAISAAIVCQVGYALRGTLHGHRQRQLP